MEELKGLYLELPACGHTYGISAINDNFAYECLDDWFCSNRDIFKIFRQSDSQYRLDGDTHYLLIEFLGENLDDEKALALAELVARTYGIKLAGII